eukprot:sb/3464557/
MNNMDECEWLTSFDFTKGFNQIKLDEESKPLTAFTYKNTRYQWTRLIMGHCSSSSIFAKSMAELFQKVPFQALICFLDDVLIGSNTVDEHLDRLEFVLARLSFGGLKISPSKTQLFRKQVKFLGHIMNKNGISIDPARVDAIKKLQLPKSVKELQKFLGAVNYNRSFIKDYSKIATPLYDMLQKKRKFEWNPTSTKAFEDLKNALGQTPVLVIPNYQHPDQNYELTIDSSKIGHGATLNQVLHGKKRTIAYWSKSVPVHQRKFGATRLEFLGLCHALKHFRMYLMGTKRFKVLTDCKALLNLKTIFKKESSYIHRKIAELEEYNFDIVHIAGESVHMGMTDYLSRHPIPKTNCVGTQTLENDTRHRSDDKQRNITDHVVQVNKSLAIDIPVTLTEIKQDYADDVTLSTVIGWLKNKNTPKHLSSRKTRAELLHYWRQIKMLHVEKEVYRPQQQRK